MVSFDLIDRTTRESCGGDDRDDVENNRNNRN